MCLLSRLEQVPEQIAEYPEFSMFRELPAWGFYVRHASNIHLKNVKLYLDKEDFRPAFVFDDVDGLQMEDLDLPAEAKDQIIFKEVSGDQLDAYSSRILRVLSSDD